MIQASDGCGWRAGRRWLWLLVLLMLPGAVAWGQQGLAQVSQVVVNQSALRPGDQAVVAVVVDVDEGYHAQSHRPLEENLIPFRIALAEHQAVEAGQPLYDQGHIEEYPMLGRLSVYTGRVVTYVPVKVSADAQPGEVMLAGEVSLQICDDQMCFPPETLSFELKTKIVSAGTSVELSEPQLFKQYESRRVEAQKAPDAPPQDVPPPQDEPTTAPATDGARVDYSGFEGANWSMGFAFTAAFLAGLLFNIMPCVLPVLPIKAKGFYEVAHHRRSQAFVYGMVFSVGLISVFAILAMVVLVFKAITWGGLFSNPVFIWSIVAVLVFLSLGMFGGYDTSLPTFIYNFQPRHDTYPGNFFWGALMAILATPCTAPLLPPLLLWATLQPAVVGVPAIIMVGVGMASPYMILSAFPELARGIPRSGPGAELFKQMLGFAMLAAAAYFGAGRIIHDSSFMWVVVAVVAVAALYLMARTVQIWKTAMPVAISAVLSVAMLGGTLWWTARLTGLLRPPVVLAAGNGNGQAGWTAFSESAFEAARKSGKPVLVKFTANWCATCQVIEGNVFQEPKVWAALAARDVAVFKADLTESTAEGWARLRQLNPAGGIPLTAVYTPGADQPIVLASIYTTDTLLSTLNQALPTRVAGK